MFFKKGVLKIFTLKLLCWSLFLMKLQDLTFSEGIEKEHWPEMS